MCLSVYVSPCPNERQAPDVLNRTCVHPDCPSPRFTQESSKGNPLSMLLSLIAAVQLVNERECDESPAMAVDSERRGPRYPRASCCLPVVCHCSIIDPLYEGVRTSVFVVLCVCAGVGIAAPLLHWCLVVDEAEAAVRLPPARVRSSSLALV